MGNAHNLDSLCITFDSINEKNNGFCLYYPLQNKNKQEKKLPPQSFKWFFFIGHACGILIHKSHFTPKYSCAFLYIN